MTFISKELIFIHVPKAAGTSVKVTLKKNLNEANYENIDNNDHHSYLQIVKIDNKLFRNRISFALVRNPYERFVSIYRFVNRPFKLNKWFGNLSFEVAKELILLKNLLKILKCPIGFGKDIIILHHSMNGQKVLTKFLN